MDLNKAVEHCWDRRDYPEIISDDAGLDISIPRFITRGPWKEHNRPRRITLNVTTYIGTSWNAVHYYGNLDIEGISFSQEDSPNTMTMCSETYDAEEKNPLAGGMYHIELVRLAKKLKKIIHGGGDMRSVAILMPSILQKM